MTEDQFNKLSAQIYATQVLAVMSHQQGLTQITV